MFFIFSLIVFSSSTFVGRCMSIPYLKMFSRGACRSLFANGRLTHAPLFHKISKYTHAIKRNAFLNVAVKLLFSVTGRIWCHYYVYRCLPVETLFTMLATCFSSLLDSVNRCQFDDFLAFYGNQPVIHSNHFLWPLKLEVIFIFMQSSSSHLKKFQDENFLPVEILMIFLFAFFRNAWHFFHEFWQNFPAVCSWSSWNSRKSFFLSMVDILPKSGAFLGDFWMNETSWDPSNIANTTHVCKTCNKKPPFARGMNHSVEEGRLSSNGCLEHRFCEAILGRFVSTYKEEEPWILDFDSVENMGILKRFVGAYHGSTFSTQSTISVCPCPTQEPKSWIWAFWVVRW